MKSVLFSVSFLLAVVCVRSHTEPNMDHFVMTEGHITEYRNNQDVHARFVPFYVECFIPETKFNCQPVIPKLDKHEGHVIIRNYLNKNFRKKLYYGCPQEIKLDNVLNPGRHFEKSLLMKRVAPGDDTLEDPPRWYNIYKYRCDSDVSPTIWRMGSDEGHKLLYGIGFLIPTLEQMPLAKVYFDYKKKIPIWTQHTVYGNALAAPIASFRTIEEIEYETDSQNYSNNELIEILETYYQFNYTSREGEMSETKKLFHDTLKDHKLRALPEESRIVLGHLIPEYDMIMTNWKKIPRFAQTIVPTWENLYLNEWVDVEEMIRNKAFENEMNLKVFSGTHGHMTFKGPAKLPFYLGTKEIVVPEMIWKLVIYSHENSSESRATVIIFPNISEELVSLRIFTPFQQPCNRICRQFVRRNPSDPNKPIYCCQVTEVINKIELPAEVRTETGFQPLFT